MSSEPFPKADDVTAITAKVKRILADRAGKAATAIRDEDDLLVDLGLDSLALADLTTVLEQHLQRPVGADELLDVVTVGDLAGLVARMGQRHGE